MVQIFGFSTVSISRVNHALTQKGIKNIAILDVNFDLNKSSKYNVIIAPDVSTVLKYKTVLSNIKSLLVVFDNPILLRNIDSIKLLDAKIHNDITDNILTTDSPIKTKSIINALKKPKKLKINHTSKNLLTKIIAFQTSAGFFDKFNSLLYAVSTSANRDAVKNNFILYILERKNKDQLLSSIAKHHKLKEEQNKLIANFVEYFNTTQGIALRNALQYAVTEDVKNIKAKGKSLMQYKKIADKFGIDKFELHSLMNLYKQIPKK